METVPFPITQNGLWFLFGVGLALFSLWLWGKIFGEKLPRPPMHSDSVFVNDLIKDQFVQGVSAGLYGGFAFGTCVLAVITSFFAILFTLGPIGVWLGY